jgi:hypothetical protein
MIIEDLLHPGFELAQPVRLPEMNPLAEEGALQEAQLLDVRFDAVRSTVGILFDLRLALQLREANTGALIAGGVRALAWTAEARSTTRTAWTVGNSLPYVRDKLFELSIGLWPNAQLSLISESAVFYLGDIVGLGRIPDYVDDDEATIYSQLAGWRSDITLMRSVHF